MAGFTLGIVDVEVSKIPLSVVFLKIKVGNIQNIVFFVSEMGIHIHKPWRPRALLVDQKGSGAIKLC